MPCRKEKSHAMSKLRWLVLCRGCRDPAVLYLCNMYKIETFKSLSMRTKYHIGSRQNWKTTYKAGADGTLKYLNLLNSVLSTSSIYTYNSSKIS